MFGKANRRHSKILWGIWDTAFSLIWTLTQLAAAWNNFPFWVLKLQTVQYNFQKRGSFNPWPILAEERLSKYVCKLPSIKHNAFSTSVFVKGMIKAHLAVHQEQEWLEAAEEPSLSSGVKNHRSPSFLMTAAARRNISAFTLTSFCLNDVQMWEFNHLCSALELCSVQC